MCTISTTEFKNNFGKYIEMGQREEIKVLKRGRVIFTIVPESLSLLEEAKKYIGMLPKDASIGIDPYERG
ncbi:MAG: type II toxin-antitoxin system prevent-host-death family antitoxin [Bacilli bacterium]|nr:type II toxin-antitoxin system prevent-host-death family antitoxin [Bacilli bacterium]